MIDRPVFLPCLGNNRTFDTRCKSAGVSGRTPRADRPGGLEVERRLKSWMCRDLPRPAAVERRCPNRSCSTRIANDARSRLRAGGSTRVALRPMRSIGGIDPGALSECRRVRFGRAGERAAGLAAFDASLQRESEDSGRKHPSRRPPCQTAGWEDRPFGSPRAVTANTKWTIGLKPSGCGRCWRAS
jgi:hypothetical protein